VQFAPFFPGLFMLSPASALPDPESLTLKDGTQVIIRPIQPDDADDLQTAFQRLSMESIYLRFLSFKKELPEEEARYLASVDYTSRMAFVAICKENNRDIVVGVARYAMLENVHPEIAESAVVVEDEYQGRGLGKLLLSRLVNYARTRGIHYLRGNLQIGNNRMLDLVRRSGLPHQTRFVDGFWEVTIDLEQTDEELYDPEIPSPAELASTFDAEQSALTIHNTDTERAICRKYSNLVCKASAEYVLTFARKVLFTHGHRWQAYELIAGHKAAFHRLGADELEELGQGINSWWSTDSFARTLSGPAWQDGLVSDDLIVKWAKSPDVWWRRAALVSTVAFNIRSQGGKGDVPRTLTICRMQVADHEDMVVKALSWALRELVYFDPQAVEGFIREHEHVLAGRVKREVGSKLRTGLKNPKRKEAVSR
jgi:3-methyladenine DNA glycosylase AlkD/GNAT superfamily N-acetyltransferase